MTASTPTLGEALASLVAAATAAGLDRDRARAEGEALAATVAESATGAHVDWITHTSGASAQDFFDAASRGRRWRANPTVLLSELTQADRGRARPYAEALADVCTAATQLGTPEQRVLGNAALAASAQLAAVGGAASPSLPDQNHQSDPTHQSDQTPPTPSPGPIQSAASDRLDAVRTTGQQVLQRLLNQVTNTPAGGGGAGNPLDVAAADGPGAFPGLGGTGIADPELLRRLRPGGNPTPADPNQPNPNQPNSDQSNPDQPDPTRGTAAPTQPEQAGAAEEDRTQTAGTAPADEADEEPVEDPPTLDELLAELDSLIGLDSVKAEIHRQVAVLRVEKLRTEAGLAQPTITRHLIFTGNPGTGKTTVARLVAGIYRALGLLSKGQLVEVDRSELVAGYLGQTAIKTSEVVESAVGGVLFIDEAYSLAGDQYGTEAVDTLVKETEDRRDDLVVIVAGYPDPMAVFIAQNPGLSSRFRTTIAFEDYTDEELSAIFASMATSADYDLTEDAERRFRSILSTTPRGSTFGNGRFARNCLEGAIGRHAWRLRDVAEPTVEQLRAIAADDLADEGSESGPAGTNAASTEEASTEEVPTEEVPTDEAPTVADRPAVEDEDE